MEKPKVDIRVLPRTFSRVTAIHSDRHVINHTIQYSRIISRMDSSIQTFGTLASCLSLLVKEHEPSKVVFDIIRNRMEEIAERFREISKDTAAIMLAGSSYDKLNLSRLWKNEDGKQVFYPAIDFDITMSYIKHPIEDMTSYTSSDVDHEMMTNEVKNSDCFGLMLSTDDPRFVKMKITCAGRQMLQRPGCKIEELINKDGYIPNYIFKANLFPKLYQKADVLYEREPSGYIEAGPALSNVEHEDKGYTYDFVNSFPVPVWPAVASRWKTRPRPCNWPPDDIVQTIIKEGCAIVPVGSHSGVVEERDLEWRISFTNAERMLARSLSPLQRTCYCVVKLMLKTYMPPEAAFSSYHLKNMLFWFCEQQYQGSEWTEGTLGTRIIQFLKYVRQALEHSYIPHYILSKSNLISHRSKEDITVAIETISRVITEPFKTLMAVCNKIHCFDIHSGSELVYGQNEVQTMLILYTTFVQTLYKFGIISLPTPLAQDCFQLVIQLNGNVKHLIKTASPAFAAQSLSELLKPLAIAYMQSGEIENALALYNTMKSRDYDNVEANFPETFTNIACLYTRKADASSDPKEKELFESQAIENFNLALQKIDDSASLHLAYGNFLFQSKRSIRDTMEQFRKATNIKTPRDDDEALLQLRLPEKDKWVEKQVYVPGKIAGYYMLIQVLMGLEEIYEARREASKLEKDAHETQARYRKIALQVCGLCYKRTGLSVKGEILLDQASKYPN